MPFEQSQSVVKNKKRSAVRLGRNLEKHLMAYAAAAGAGILATVVPSAAEVIYTPCNTPMAIAQVNQGLALTPLDLNNDGNPDFSFLMSSAKIYSVFRSSIGFRFFLKVAPEQKGNEAVQGQQPSTVFAVPPNAQIGPQQEFGTGNLYLALKSYNNGYRISGTWWNVEYSYVGLKFLIDGQVHYGWARVKFPFPGGVGYPSIYGYAYESTPNQPIITGQTSGKEQKTTSSIAPSTLGLLAAGAPAINLWR